MLNEVVVGMYCHLQWLDSRIDRYSGPCEEGTAENYVGQAIRRRRERPSSPTHCDGPADAHVVHFRVRP